jgi:ferrochelatase
MLNREVFMQAGGKSFQYIPALNSSDAHIQAITELALKHMQGWDQLHTDYDEDNQLMQKMVSQQLARQLGAEK